MQLATFVFRSFIIWINTCAIGSIYHWVSHAIIPEPWVSFTISLIFSSPALIFQIPNFYVLTSIVGIRYRIFYGVVSQLALCGIVVLIFISLTDGYRLENNLMVSLLIPYVIAAQLMFFLVAWSFIDAKHEPTSSKL